MHPDDPDCLLLPTDGYVAADLSWEFIMMSQLKKKQMRTKQSHLENETAVDKQQSSENGQILLKIDTKVSFKCRRPWVD